MKCTLIGVPVQDGASRLGCEMGPSALRTAGIGPTLRDLGHDVSDLGDIRVDVAPDRRHPNDAVHDLGKVALWVERLAETAYAHSDGAMPIFLGGDHVLSAGTVAGLARRASEQGRPLFVLWLYAHTDFHTPQTSDSGNLHGTPLGYVTGREGFDGFPVIDSPLPHDNIAMIGLRSVDAAERAALQETTVTYVDMREIDESGIAKPLQRFLDKVAAAGGMLHVSLDVDFLDPSVAPAVGTTVPGGATVREGHLVMEMLSDSGLMTSLDLVELNPFLDERGRTAQLMVDLTASAFGRRVFDRPTRAY